ncbi:KR domain-containing protein [Xylaria palmicola]|nr:KR domain-containing protein [Xylaria palmicola]
MKRAFFRTVQNRDHMGKVIVEFKPNDAVNTQDQASNSAPMRHTESLAALGVQVEASRAGSPSPAPVTPILLSRSGAKSTEAQEFVAELTSCGTQICLPVRGCIQSSMVLRGGMFEGTTFESWRESTMPKIQGSWNLHSSLPDGMDFFVLFSPIPISAVIGNRGPQSNYAVGNTFEDALAQYRVAKGERWWQWYGKEKGAEKQPVVQILLEEIKCF